MEYDSAFSADNLVIKDKKIVYKDIRDNHENIVELDVTDWVKKAYAENGQTKFSFLMLTDYFGEYANGDNGGIDFASREASGMMEPTIVLSNVYEMKVDAVSVSTSAGKKPVLPETVTVTYSNEETKSVTVEWNSINPANYQTEGTFVVYGKSRRHQSAHYVYRQCYGSAAQGGGCKAIFQELFSWWEHRGRNWDFRKWQPCCWITDRRRRSVSSTGSPIMPTIRKRNFLIPVSVIWIWQIMIPSRIRNRSLQTVSVSIIEPEDKNALLVLYTEAAGLINSGEVGQLTESAKNRFMKAFNKAAEVLVNTKATELKYIRRIQS